MYAGNYYTQDREISIPENYDGTALIDATKPKEEASHPRIDIPKTEMKISPKDEKKEYAPPPKEANEAFSQNGLFDFPSLLKGRFLKELSIGSLIPEIGREEILLIALAAFLMFSKQKDLECAIMLLFLIFIK